jgi:hypothetical protein
MLYYTPTELTDLEADAATAGVTVEQLMKNRLLRRPDDSQGVTTHRKPA